MLKPYYKTLDEKIEDYKITFSRLKEMKKLVETFPQNINGEISFNEGLGKTYPRVIIFLDKKITKEQMQEVIKWIISLNGKAERFLRENRGTFSWISEVKFDGWKGGILIENAYHECKIIKKKKEIEYYEADCVGEGR